MVTLFQKRASSDRRAKNQAHGQTRGHARTRARPILPGRSYKVTRRCHGRRMLLAPGKIPGEMANLFGYCLAYAAEKYGVQIHACVAMSNHYHADLTDVRGQLPAFKQLFHSLVARSLNAIRGQDDSFWSADPACDTRRPTDDDTFMDLVYTLTNPVSAGLVNLSSDWPGFTTMNWRFGETRTFHRPMGSCFDENGNMPKSVSLTLVRPPVFTEIDDQELYEWLQSAVRRREREVQAELARTNRRFMGLRDLEKVHWSRVARSFEEWFTITPKVAGSTKRQRWRELQRDRIWERRYVAARELLRAGLDAVFPAGTYWLRRFAGVCVAEESAKAGAWQSSERVWMIDPVDDTMADVSS